MRFLALLELCKMGRVTLGQGTTFGDLRISWLAGDETGRRGERPRAGRAGGLSRSTTTKGEGLSPWSTPSWTGQSRPSCWWRSSPCRPSCWPSCWRSPSSELTRRWTSWPESYERERRGFVLARIAGGARLQTHPDLAPYVERFANREVSHRLSTAALETLAIVAYRQPVSRGQISALRGVNVDGVTRLLEQRGLHRGRGPRRGTGPAGAVRHDRPLPRAARARLARPAAAGGGASCPGPRWPASSSATCSRRSGSASRRPPTTPEAAGGRAPAEGAGPGRARIEAGLRGADRGRAGDRRRRGRRPGRRIDRRRPGSSSTGSLVPVAPDSSTTC